LNQLRATILTMSEMVDKEMTLAMKALQKKDIELAQEVFAMDDQINAMRYQNERTALLLISTQQPMARDARFILASLFMNVILERMGDKAKSIAKAIPYILQRPNLTIPPELQQMADMGQQMLRDAMQAYAIEDVELALKVANVDDEVDQLYGETFFSVLARLTKTKKPDKVEAIYELIRIARDLERFGDYATDLAERVDFMITGQLADLNTEEWNDVQTAAVAEQKASESLRADEKSTPSKDETAPKR
jgi:phosphate transport system protein